ncbi:MAG: VPLPA-CTERM sorting domain-containing protein [Methylococcales bacterium]|nr:VPLPA-CTERM sorting domain-containing protein [Methylococcales bacterium]
MKKNILAAALSIFLFPLTSQAASITNTAVSGGGFISGNGLSSATHSGISSRFFDTWSIAFDGSDETFNIITSNPLHESFNIEYKANSASDWTTYTPSIGATTDSFVHLVSVSTANLFSLDLRLFGDVGSTTGGYNLNTNGVSNVPLPAAVWLFGSALMGVIGASRRKPVATA